MLFTFGNLSKTKKQGKKNSLTLILESKDIESWTHNQNFEN